MGIRNRWAWAATVAGAALGLAGSVVWVTEVSAAPSACGALPAGVAVYVDCGASSASTPYTTYRDGEQVNLAMGANSMFSGPNVGADVEAIECEYSTGTGPGDPPDTNYCSAQTLAGGFPYAVHTNGGFDYAADHPGDTVTVFALPDTTLSGAAIKCDSAHPCVWYVGENYNDFKAPHVFSNPFVVSASGSSPTSVPSSAPGISVPVTAGAAGQSASSPAQLAYTGPTALPVWTAVLGLVLLAAGLLGRRLLLRGSR